MIVLQNMCGMVVVPQWDISQQQQINSPLVLSEDGVQDRECDSSLEFLSDVPIELL